MKWTLKEIRQETDHPFLNYYTLIYDVLKDGKHYTYSYYLSSRNDKEHLLSRIHDYQKVDGVLIPLYYIDPKTNETLFVLTKQFRPAVGTYVHSVPAGLVDKDDKDVFMTAKREAKEEIGVDIIDLELLAPSSFTSSGLSDETCAVVLARIDGFEDKCLEEFEDIGFKFIKLKEMEGLLKDNKVIIALNIRLIFLYLLQRFKR